MPAQTRILLVEDSPAEWRLALSSLSEVGLVEGAAVVGDRGEALDFLHGRGRFRNRPGGLPCLVVVGPNLSPAMALTLLRDIKTDQALRRIPVVIVAAADDVESVRSAYEQGVNGVMRAHPEATVHGSRYAALASFWARANEPPPGCVRPDG